jgi:hypothetical protein
MPPTLKGLHPRPARSILVAMPQSLARILVHTVFSTKDRRPLLRDAALRQECHHYLGGILKHLDCQPILRMCDATSPSRSSITARFHFRMSPGYCSSGMNLHTTNGM